jgi:hypothetical protein
MPVLPYVEEHFGVLTDDDLYLDCILVKPANMKDEQLKVLRVWVPKYPLTKTSVLTCAQQEVKSYGPNGKIAHLVFDLRGTGNSDGIAGDFNFQLDMRAIAAWAQERFGKINFGFLGYPTVENGRVHMWPIRLNTFMESYFYTGATSSLQPPCILYLSTYGNFSREDDKICHQLAQLGYDVYGVDPLRYLLHASAEERLTPEILAQDFELLAEMLPNYPTIIGQPLAAGLALMWASISTKAKGVIAVGRAQAGLTPPHIFDHKTPSDFALNQLVSQISPRPTAYVIYKQHQMGGQDGELSQLYDLSEEPRLLRTTSKLDLPFYTKTLRWLAENHPENA